MDPIRIRPSAGCVPSRPALLRNFSRSLQWRPGKINTQSPFKPDAGQLFQHGRRKEHCVDDRTVWKPIPPTRAQSWPIARARRTRFGRAACLQNKTIKLGQHCDVFSALAYWNPTHRRMETVMHLPRGQRLPDVNRLVCVLPNGSPIGRWLTALATPADDRRRSFPGRRSHDAIKCRSPGNRG